MQVASVGNQEHVSIHLIPHTVPAVRRKPFDLRTECRTASKSINNWGGNSTGTAKNLTLCPFDAFLRTDKITSDTFGKNLIHFRDLQLFSPQRWCHHQNHLRPPADVPPPLTCVNLSLAGLYSQPALAPSTNATLVPR